MKKVLRVTEFMDLLTEYKKH